MIPDENTLASNEFESMDRLTHKTYRCNHSALRGLWRMYYLIISIKNKIHDYLFIDVYGIDREDTGWTEAYGSYQVQKTIEQLLLIKAQEKYMESYYRLPQEETE